jgi:hypothetical protein
VSRTHGVCTSTQMVKGCTPKRGCRRLQAGACCTLDSGTCSTGVLVRCLQRVVPCCRHAVKSSRSRRRSTMRSRSYLSTTRARGPLVTLPFGIYCCLRADSIRGIGSMARYGGRAAVSPDIARLCRDTLCFVSAKCVQRMVYTIPDEVATQTCLLHWVWYLNCKDSKGLVRLMPGCNGYRHHVMVPLAKLIVQFGKMRRRWQRFRLSLLSL